MNYDAPFSPSQLSIITYYYHTLSSSGADNPASRYQPLRFCYRTFPPVDNSLLST
jgi:hypothetical protein